MKTNWIVRLKNKDFWIALVPAIFLLIQQIAAIFGYTIDFSVLSEQVLAVINTVFVILAIVGIVNDPTTKGLKDSARAMLYDSPKE